MSNFENLVIPSYLEHIDFLFHFAAYGPKEEQSSRNKIYWCFIDAWTRQNIYHEQRMLKNNGNS